MSAIRRELPDAGLSLLTDDRELVKRTVDWDPTTQEVTAPVAAMLAMAGISVQAYSLAE
jgi:hypothetical protein